MKKSSIACSRHRITASAWRCSGSISRATPTRMAITSIAPRDVALARLGHQGVQQQHAVRPVHGRATRRRPVAESHADQQIATGFNRNHMINFEGGAIPDEYQNEYIVDRIEATSTTFLALRSDARDATITNTTRSPRRTSTASARSSTACPKRAWTVTRVMRCRSFKCRMRSKPR